MTTYLNHSFRPKINILVTLWQSLYFNPNLAYLKLISPARVHLTRGPNLASFLNLLPDHQYFVILYLVPTLVQAYVVSWLKVAKTSSFPFDPPGPKGEALPPPRFPFIMRPEKPVTRPWVKTSKFSPSLCINTTT